MTMIVLAYAATLVYASFAEWTLHRYVMHRRAPLVRFPYELHAVGHHGMFGADETYHAITAEMREHITFVPRDYLILLAIHAPFFVGVEALVGLPFFAPAGALALLTYLLAFDVLHWGFHVPADNWLQRTRAFRFLKEHHRIHHARHDVNVNVVAPLADLVLGTLHLRLADEGTPNAVPHSVECQGGAGPDHKIDKG